MSIYVCVSGTTLLITAMPPLVAVVVTPSIEIGTILRRSNANKSFYVKTKEVLLEEDLKEWCTKFKGTYVFPPYVLPTGPSEGGQVECNGPVTVSQLSKNLHYRGKKILMQTSYATMTLKVTQAAKAPPPVNPEDDPNKAYIVRVSIVNQGQESLRAESDLVIES